MRFLFAILPILLYVLCFIPNLYVNYPVDIVHKLKLYFVRNHAKRYRLIKIIIVGIINKIVCLERNYNTL